MPCARASLLLLASLTPGAAAAQTVDAVPDSVRDLPGVEVRANVRHYQIREVTFAAVVARLNGMRLEGAVGRAQGLTRYRIRPEWRAAAAGGRCRIATVVVRATIEITLPAWPGYGKRPIEEQEGWNRAESAIRLHEFHHRDLVIAAARALRTDLLALEATGCGNLRRAVTGVLALTEERLDAAHAALDRRPASGPGSTGPR